MEFRAPELIHAVLFGIAGLLLAGCSDSSGYVDYSEIEAPAASQKSGDENSAAGNTRTESPSKASTGLTPTTSPQATPPEAANTAAVQPGEGRPEDGGTASTAGVGDATQKPTTKSDTGPDTTDDQATARAVKTVSKTDGADSKGGIRPSDVAAAVEGTEPADATSATERPSDGMPAEGNAATGVDSGSATAAAQSTEGTTGEAPANQDQAAVDGATSSTPREIKLLIPEKRFRPEGDAQALRLSYDDIDLLKVLNMEPVPADAVEYFPDWLRSLDGKRIRLRGFMFPTFVATGITNFGLARDNGICCFVKQPKVYDMIEVSLADGESTDYIENKPFDVEGIFRIDPDADDNELFQLYRIEDAIVLR
ncbi:MAG: hypothetical protein RIK87_27640 [Fuerstiella sp.]